MCTGEFGNHREERQERGGYGIKQSQMFRLGCKLTMLSRGAGLVNAKMAKWMKTDFWIASGFHPRGLLILHTSVRLRSQRIASRSCTGYYPCTDYSSSAWHAYLPYLVVICHTLLIIYMPARIFSSREISAVFDLE